MHGTAWACMRICQACMKTRCGLWCPSSLLGPHRAQAQLTFRNKFLMTCPGRELASASVCASTVLAAACSINSNRTLFAENSRMMSSLDSISAALVAHRDATTKSQRGVWIRSDHLPCSHPSLGDLMNEIIGDHLLQCLLMFLQVEMWATSPPCSMGGGAATTIRLLLLN